MLHIESYALIPLSYTLMPSIYGILYIIHKYIHISYLISPSSEVPRDHIQCRPLLAAAVSVLSDPSSYSQGHEHLYVNIVI